MLRRLRRVLLVLWAGSLWSLAWVTSIVFRGQSDRHLAGVLNGRLFSLETYLGISVAVLALLLPGRGKFMGVYVAAALLAVNEWALRHVMTVARLNGVAAGLTFGAWHGVSMLLYVMACIAVLVVIWNEDER